MEFEILGWPPDGPKLRLDHERFSYAGKFVMTNTGKAVARTDGEVVAAVAFNEDRTDDATVWLRYVTVAREKRGEGIGPQLVGFVRDRVLERSHNRLKIAVNNPYAYEALTRTGFEFTGETTGLAELVLAFPPGDEASAPDEKTTDDKKGSNEFRIDPARYRAGLEEFRSRDLVPEERSFLDERLERGPPTVDGEES